MQHSRDTEEDVPFNHSIMGGWLNCLALVGRRGLLPWTNGVVGVADLGLRCLASQGEAGHHGRVCLSEDGHPVAVHDVHQFLGEGGSHSGN